MNILYFLLGICGFICSGLDICVLNTLHKQIKENYYKPLKRWCIVKSYLCFIGVVFLFLINIFWGLFYCLKAILNC